MAAVTLKSVSKLFGANAVVHDVNLEIPDREFVVMVGPSGCGKTTTLRMIAGLEDVTDVDISIGDVLESGDHAQRRRLAAAGRTHHDDEFAVRYLEVDVVHHRVGAEKFRYALERDCCHAAILFGQSVTFCRLYRRPGHVGRSLP